MLNGTGNYHEYWFILIFIATLVKVSEENSLNSQKSCQLSLFTNPIRCWLSLKQQFLGYNCVELSTTWLKEPLFTEFYKIPITMILHNDHSRFCHRIRPLHSQLQINEHTYIIKGTYQHYSYNSETNTSWSFLYKQYVFWLVKNLM